MRNVLDEWIYLVVGALSLGLGGLGAFLRHAQSLPQRMLARPLHTVGTAPEGEEVRVHGTVSAEPGQLLHSPITERPCVAWKLTIQRGQANAPWVTFHERQDTRSFRLADETGVASIPGAAAELHLTGVRRRRDSAFAHTRTPPAFAPANPKLLAYIRAHCPPRSYTSYRYRFAEGVVEVGDALTVAGRARHFDDPDATPHSYRERDVILRLDPLPHGKVLMGDHADFMR